MMSGGSARRAGGTSPDPTTPGLIKARVPDARIMIALRDPVERVLVVLARREVRHREPAFRRSRRMNSSTTPAAGRRRPGEARLPRLLLTARGGSSTCSWTPSASASSRISTPTRPAKRRSSSSSTSLRSWRSTSPGAHNVFAQPRNRLAGRLMASPRARAGGRTVFPEPLRTWVENLVLRGRSRRSSTRDVSKPRSQPTASRSSGCSAGQFRGSPLLAHSGSEGSASRDRGAERPGSPRRCRELRARCHLPADARTRSAPSAGSRRLCAQRSEPVTS